MGNNISYNKTTCVMPGYGNVEVSADIQYSPPMIRARTETRQPLSFTRSFKDAIFSKSGTDKFVLLSTDLDILREDIRAVAEVALSQISKKAQYTIVQKIIVEQSSVPEFEGTRSNIISGTGKFVFSHGSYLSGSRVIYGGTSYKGIVFVMVFKVENLSYNSESQS